MQDSCSICLSLSLSISLTPSPPSFPIRTPLGIHSPVNDTCEINAHVFTASSEELQERGSLTAPRVAINASLGESTYSTKFPEKSLPLHPLSRFTRVRGRASIRIRAFHRTSHRPRLAPSGSLVKFARKIGSGRKGSREADMRSTGRHAI